MQANTLQAGLGASWREKRLPFARRIWRNQDAMSHDRQPQPSPESHQSPLDCRYLVIQLHVPSLLEQLRRARPTVADRSSCGPGGHSSCAGGQRRGVYQSMGGGSITNRLQFGVGGCPRVVVPKKASCFPQLGSSCMCPFAACLAEPLIGGIGARDWEVGAPSLRLDISPAAPTHMDAQVMSIKNTSSTTFAAQRNEVVDFVETKYRHSRTRPVVMQS
jgi:hypothetical protein